MLQEIPNPPEDISQYDKDFTFKNRDFQETEQIIEDFLTTHPNKHWKEKKENTIIIKVDGYWSTNDYATFVIDKTQRKLFLRIREPHITLNLQDGIEQRDNFARKFSEFLNTQNIEH